MTLAPDLTAAETTLRAFRQELEADCESRGIPVSFLTVGIFGAGDQAAPFCVNLYLSRSVGNLGHVHGFRGATFTEAMTKAREGVKNLAPTMAELSALIGAETAA